MSKYVTTHVYNAANQLNLHAALNVSSFFNQSVENKYNDQK